MSIEGSGMELSLLQKDVISEMMNIAAGRAAASLAAILRNHVQMHVVEIGSINQNEIKNYMASEIGEVGSVVQQQFSGGFTGNSLLVLTRENTENLIQTLLRQNRTLASLTSTEQTILTEVGNIILTACVSMFANQTGRRLHYSLPRVFLNLKGDALAAELVSGEKPSIEGLVLKSHLTVGKVEVTIYILILMIMDEETIRGIIEDAVHRYLKI